MSLEIRGLTVEAVPVLELGGRLEESTWEQLDAVLRDRTTSETKRLVLDLSGLAYVSSSGVGVIAAASGRMNKHGGKLALGGAHGIVKRVLDITGISSAVPSFETALAAVTALEKEVDT